MGVCVLVLGSTRSGTSAVAGVLHRLGVVMGWELERDRREPDVRRFDWPDATAANPVGFYQDAPIENAQDAIWGDDYPLENTAVPPGRGLDWFRELIHMRAERGLPLWGMKNSRTAWMLDELIQESPGVSFKFVVTRRDPEHSARSLDAHWTDYGIDQCREWVRRINSQVDLVLDSPKYADIPRLIVPFSGLHSAPRSSVDCLAEFVGTPTTDEAVQFLDPRLWRVR